VITIVAKDNKGQESTFTATVHVKVDKLPTVKDVSVVIGNKTIIAENDTSTSVVFAEIPESGMLTFTATDDIGLQSYTVYVNDVPWYYQGVIGSGLQISKTIEIPVEEGENQIEIKAVDKSGQEALYSFVVVITLDTTAPAISDVTLGGKTINEDEENYLSADSVADWTLSFKATDNVEVTDVVVQIDGTELTGPSVVEGDVYSYTLSALDPGEYLITITVEDAAGNKDEFSFTLIVDNEKPTLVSLKAIDTNGDEVTAVDGQLQWEFGHAVATIEAVVSESVEIVDEALAVVYMLRGETPVRYGTFVLDSSDPTKIIITPDEGNETAGELGTFTFKVEAGVVKDLAGNTNDEITIVLVVEDGEAPAISDVTLGDVTVSDENETVTLGFTSVAGTTLSFKATDNVEVTDVVVQIGTATYAITPVEGDVYSYTLSALDPGEYLITITVEDAAGNKDEFSFTLVVEDDEAPAISDVTLGDVTVSDENETVTLGFTSVAGTTLSFKATDNVEVTDVVVQIGTATYAITPVEGDVYSHVLSALDPGEYLITITVEDAAGNKDEFSFTLVVEDDEAPAISDVTLGDVTVSDENETVTLGFTSVAGTTLSFKATDNVEVTDVVVQIGTATYAITPVEGDVYSHVLSALDPGEYLITITVEDAAGNKDEFSFTLVVEDDEAPAISDVTLGDVTVSDENETVTLGFTSVAGTTLSFKATDNVEVTDVVVQIGTATYAITPVEGDVYSHVLSALDPGEYLITITVEDAAGNKDEFSFTLVVEDDEAPAISDVTLGDVTVSDENETVTLGFTSVAGTTLSFKATDNVEVTDVVVQIGTATYAITPVEGTFIAMCCQH